MKMLLRLLPVKFIQQKLLVKLKVLMVFAITSYLRILFVMVELQEPHKQQEILLQIVLLIVHH
jgi:hypothetical protein